MVTVTTTLRGASVEEMETAVTKPIEEAVNTVSGIDELRSTTKRGHLQVVIGFKLEKNGDIAAQEVDAKVRTILAAAARRHRPADRREVRPRRRPGDDDRRVRPARLREVTEIAKKLKEDLETVTGVGAVVLVGGRPRAVNVIVDPDKLQKYENLSVEDVRQALVRENLEHPGGRVDRRQSRAGAADARPRRAAEDFEELIVANRNGQPVRDRGRRPGRRTASRSRAASADCGSRGDGARRRAGPRTPSAWSSRSSRRQHGRGRRHDPQAARGDCSRRCRRTSASRSSATSRGSSRGRSRR